MSIKFRIITIIYTLISSVTVLVMLTTSFELFNEKYLPAFILAQKYALPIIVTAMAITFLTFFEPERLSQKNTLIVMRVCLVVTFLTFSYYLTTLNLNQNSIITLIVFIIQWIATLYETVRFFLLKNTTAAL
ncbi:MAG: hypothetical protein WDA22_13670 [Bacteroidota bacterium]